MHAHLELMETWGLTSCMPQMKAKVHLPVQHPMVSSCSSAHVLKKVWVTPKSPAAPSQPKSLRVVRLDGSPVRRPDQTRPEPKPCPCWRPGELTQGVSLKEMMQTKSGPLNLRPTLARNHRWNLCGTSRSFTELVCVSKLFPCACNKELRGTEMIRCCHAFSCVVQTHWRCGCSMSLRWLVASNKGCIYVNRGCSCPVITYWAEKSAPRSPPKAASWSWSSG